MIVVDRVSKYYGSKAAVANMSFRIDEGECIGFLGLNGAGKSTTLRLLSCLLLPTSGRITVRGIDAEEQPNEIRKLIGYLPDRPPVYGEMTVRQYLKFVASLRGLEGEKFKARADEVIATCGLKEVADDLISTLSHGYQQRVGIAQAIVHDPALLILDEPIQGLDPVQIVEMREMIRNLRGRHTILLSTHILSEIEQTCDRILMLHNGQVEAQGTEDELVAMYKTGGALELELRGAEAAVRQAISKVQGCSISEVVSLGEGLLRVRVAPQSDVREQIAQAVVSSGIGLLSMRKHSSALESVFLRLHHDEAPGPVN